MNLIDWSDELSVNVKAIDDQHKKLVDMLNDFYEKIMQDVAEATMSAIVREMTEYTVYHFETEEKYFKQCNYDKTGEHIHKHNSFIRNVQFIQDKIDSGRVIVPLELTSFLKEWIAEHILGCDKLYQECFNKNGVF